MAFHLLQISEQDKLLGKPAFKVLGSLVLATVFWGLQEMAEVGFQCPWLAGYNEVYGVSFLLVPALVLTLLGVFLHRECLMGWRGTAAKGEGCSSQQPPSACAPGSWRMVTSLRVLYHAWVWIIVVLLDGDCYTCVQYFLRLHGPSSSSNPGEDSELIRILHFESRVIGLALLLTLVSIAVGVGCCHVSRCCGKPYYWWEYQRMYLEEVERLLLSSLKDSANRRAEDTFGSETDGGSVEDAWEHISSVGFAKIQYPDDFRAAPRPSAASPPNQQGAATDEQPRPGGREEAQRSGTPPARGELGIRSERAPAESPVPAAGVHGQAGQTEAEPAPGQEEAEKPGWRTRLRGHLLEIHKSLRRALGSGWKKPRYPEAK